MSEAPRPDATAGLVRVVIIGPAGVGTDAVRKVGAGLLGLGQQELMKTPLSPTGHEPATHWICKNYFPEAVVEKMQSHRIQHGTEILYGPGPTTAELLASRGLKRIHNSPPRP